MNDSIFYTDLSKRKMMLLDIAKENKSWKFRIRAAIVIFSVSLLILFGTIWLLLNHPTTSMGTFIFSCVGVIFFSIPVCLVVLIYKSAQYDCALPYSSIANGMLILYDDKIEYVFWKVDKDNPAAFSKKSSYKDENKYIYSIYKKDIKKISFSKNEICTIHGNANIKLPYFLEEDFFSPEDKLKKCTKYSFLMCFNINNAKQTINKWRDNNE